MTKFIVPTLVLATSLVPVSCLAAPDTGHRAVVAQSAPSSNSGSGESLSTKLNKSNGVIAPKQDVDPGMHVPAPDPHPNSTPVIPPSATGGSSAK